MTLMFRPRNSPSGACQHFKNPSFGCSPSEAFAHHPKAIFRGSRVCQRPLAPSPRESLWLPLQRPIERSIKRSIVLNAVSPLETCRLLGPTRLGVVYRANFPCLQLISSSPHLRPPRRNAKRTPKGAWCAIWSTLKSDPCPVRC